MGSSPSERRKRHRDDKDADEDRERSKRSRRRSRSREKDRERKDRRRDDRGRDREKNRDGDRHRSRRTYDDDDDRRDSPAPQSKKTTMTDEEAKIALMAKLQAQKLAEEAVQKKLAEQRKFGVPPAEPVPAPAVNKTLNPMEAAAYIDLQVNRVQELKNRIAQNKAASLLSAIQQPPKEEEKPKPEIELSKAVPEDVKPEIEVQEEEFGLLDPRLAMKGPGRGKRPTFKFVKEGEYQKQAHIQRSTARLHLLQSEIETVAKQTGISTAVKLALVTPDVDQGTSNYLPTIEWWDEHVLQKKTYESIPPDDLPIEQRYASTITRLIEHPIQLKAPDEPAVPPVLKVYLTKKERKKLRRQNRREILKEEAEKVRLGLKPPPEPKVKIGNLMKVLGTDAIQDPTRMEAHVREQMAARQQKHLKANEDRKLTKEERSDKKKRKIAEDTTLNVQVAIYRVKSLANPSKKFKVETNAKQLGMTGVIILYKDINVIIVEGGPKQQKFYKNLMLNRIKWSEEVIGQEKKKKVVLDDDDDEEDDDSPKNFNECQLIWEGIVKNRSFGDIRLQTMQAPKQVREFLDKHGVGHYWDHAYSTSVLLSEELE